MTEPKKISFFAAVLMNINIIVGSGIYLWPSLMAQIAGGISFLGWMLAGLVILPIVLTIAQAARIFPGEGGFYNYCKTALGERVGFLATWAYLLGYMGTVATLTSGIRDKLISRVGLTWVGDYPLVFYVVFMIFISLLNMINIRLISKIQSFITLLKLIPLFLMVFIIYFYWNPSFNYQIDNFSNLFGTIPLALFSFLGFESCCNISHYIKGGSTQASKVILLAFSVTVFLYTIFHLGILHIMGTEALATQGVEVFPKFMGLSIRGAQIAGLIMLIDMLLSFLNTAYGAALNNITNLNLFARRKLIFGSPFLAKLNASGMPANAALIHAIIIIALLLLVPSTQTLAAITLLGVCTTFFLTVLAVFVQSLRQKTYGTLFISTLGFLSVGFLIHLIWTTQLGTTTWDRLLYALPMLIGIPLGYVMYCYLTQKNTNTAQEQL